FTPPSTQGTVIFPGFDGGGEWGGAAFDSTSGLLYVNGNEMPWILTMVETGPRPESVTAHETTVGEQLYVRNCAACHGVDRLGNLAAGYPEVLSVKDRLEPEYAHELLRTGKGVMPAFAQLSQAERDAIVGYLFDIDQGEA